MNSIALSILYYRLLIEFIESANFVIKVFFGLKKTLFFKTSASFFLITFFRRRTARKQRERKGKLCWKKMLGVNKKENYYMTFNRHRNFSGLYFFNTEKAKHPIKMMRFHKDMIKMSFITAQFNVYTAESTVFFYKPRKKKFMKRFYNMVKCICIDQNGSI
jgi:hypothetical protein